MNTDEGDPPGEQRPVTQHGRCGFESRWGYFFRRTAGPNPYDGILEIQNDPSQYLHAERQQPPA